MRRFWSWSFDGHRVLFTTIAVCALACVLMIDHLERSLRQIAVEAHSGAHHCQLCDECPYSDPEEPTDEEDRDQRSDDL